MAIFNSYVSYYCYYYNRVISFGDTPWPHPRYPSHCEVALEVACDRVLVKVS